MEALPGTMNERRRTMGFFDRLFGRQETPPAQQPATGSTSFGGQSEPLSDEQALQRYRYMLRTAPPEMIEQAHEEAFAQLTPAQRAQVLQELANQLPDQERAAMASAQPDPKTLARMATRAELRQPGILERTFGGTGGGMGFGMGGMMAGTIFGSLVAGFVGSMIAHQFYDTLGGEPDYSGDYGAEQGSGEQLTDTTEGTYDTAEADYLDTGGDFGGDDFGGGDFGGGDL
jgi:hypothetical protein